MGVLSLVQRVYAWSLNVLQVLRFWIKALKV